MFRYKQRTCGFSLAVKSVEHKHTHSANKLTHLYLSCVWQDEKLTRCAEGVMFPIKPVLLSFWWGVKPQKTPTCCPDLSCPVLYCPILSCPSCPWLPWPIRDSHTETCHAEVLLKDRGRCLLHPSVSVCLCPPLHPALALLTLFSSPLLSLAAPGAAPLLFIHPKHCWGTPACVLMHHYGRHHGIGFSSLPLQPHLLLPAWHDCSPPKLPTLAPVCVLSSLLHSCCLFVVFYTLPTILSVPPLWLCVDVVLFLLQFCLFIECPVALFLLHVLYLTPCLVFTLTHPPK